MKYDVAIIGGGPAGLTAGIFTTRGGLKTICFEKLSVGGQASLSYDISNYPGFNSISGFDLTDKMFEQAKQTGVEFVYDEVVKLVKQRTDFKIVLKQTEYLAKKVIIATGTVPRKLGLNEQKFLSKGVSYCASCDGNFFKNKVVAIVGGGDSAFEYAEYLSRICKKIYLINRTNKFRANEFRVKNAKKIKNLEIIVNSQVTELKGKELLSEIEVETCGQKKTIMVDGLFVAIGHIPDLDYLDFKVDLDKNGYIIVDEHMKTSENNLYACGDIVSKHFKQVITACADGAIAGNSCITKEVSNEK